MENIVKEFLNKIKRESEKYSFISPAMKIEFDIDSVYICHLTPSISLYFGKWDFHFYIYFLHFKLSIRLCPDIFKYSDYNPIHISLLPYIVFQNYQRSEFPYQIEIQFYGWFYRYCFGGKTPNKITQYFRTNKFIRHFDEEK